MLGMWDPTGAQWRQGLDGTCRGSSITSTTDLLIIILGLPFPPNQHSEVVEMTALGHEGRCETATPARMMPIIRLSSYRAP